MQLSSLIGKQVLSPAGELTGYVLAAYLTRDLKKISCLLCADENEEEYFLPAKNILSCSDALIANRSRVSEPTGILCALSGAVYSYTGERLGTLGELLFGDDADPLFIVHSDGTKITLPLSRVLLGDALIVYPEGVKKPAIGRTGRKTEKKRTRTPAPAEQEADTEQVPQTPPETEPAQIQASPEDALNRVNLLGKRLKKSVYDANGYPIALAGDLVTKTVVSAARRNNRLLQLTVNTLTNVIT